MDQQLQKAGYQLDHQTGVFKKPAFLGINYSDGDDAENRIESIIQRASDLSTFSPEFKPHCTDWVSTYHLSSSRSNILRPFRFDSDLKILEIGAGCGAITRYLGECGAKVLALEGSLRRSKIARARTRDLPNVTVVCENFSEFEIEQKFDVITLIGVFEYASKYIASKNPQEAMLKNVATLLKPNGSIVLAIENQLGLKYFAGTPEDHLQIPLYGIENRYKDNEPRTFGQQTLSIMFKTLGLSDVSFFAPYPDYKLPVSIVSEEGFERKEFDASVFAWQSVKSDSQLPPSEKLSFSPELAWQAVFKEGLGLALSNSFLIHASCNKFGCLGKRALAYHYSTNRSKEYCKETLFTADSSGQVLVTSNLLSPTRNNKSLESVIKFVHPKPKPYTLGKPLSLNFIEVVSKDGWDIDQVGFFLARYITVLRRLLKGSDFTGTLSKKQDKLPGTFFDVIPQNIIIQSDDEPVIIDPEWELVEDIELGMCLFRSILLMLADVTRIGDHAEGREFSRIEFIKEGCLSAGIFIYETDIDRYLNLEAVIQEKLLGKPKENFLQWSPHDLLQSKSLLTAQSIELEEIRQLAHERLNIIDDIRRSPSWLITKPLRLIAWYKRKRKRKALIPSLLGIALYIHRTVKKHGTYRSFPLTLFRKVRRQGLSVPKQRLFEMFEDYRLSQLDERGGFPRNDYTEWVRRYDTRLEETQSIIRQRISKLPIRPVISILVPVFDPNPNWLVKCIESVKKQLYPHWELCIADDKSSNPDVIEILKGFAESDPRIKVTFRRENGHISAASNSALELATGDWVVLLDHDDELSEVALYRIVDTINRRHNVAMIYSDEDKINETGRRHDPYFKPDWNPDLFYSQNMFSHLGAYKLSLIKEVDGFRVGFEGSQDYDLALRCIEKINPDQIHHIPYVLYHWRVHQDSTSLTNDTKPYAQVAAQRALSEHFGRNGIVADVSIDRSGYRVQYALPKDLPMVTLIIPVRNRCDLLEQCVNSIFEKTSYKSYEIVVVDNGSDEPELSDYLRLLVAEEKVRVIRDDRPFNFSRLVNQGSEIARGDLVLLLNNDIEVISGDWMSEMVSHAVRPAIGAVGARLWYPNDTMQHGGLALGVGGVAGHSHKTLSKNNPGYFGRIDLVSNFSAVTGACLMVRKKLYKDVGGFNEKELGVAFNDVDFCCRLIELGYRNVWTPYADLYHHESVSRGYDEKQNRDQRFTSEIEYMRKTWTRILSADPAYSPNLTVVHEDFSYAWPPRVEVIAPNR